MVPISLNVSLVDILVCDVAEHMGALAAQYNLPPELMRIEITETAYTEESEAVRNMGARYAQGFLYYRPMPAKDFEALLDGGNNN